MRFIAAVILTALLSFSASLFMPWWIIAVAAFIVAICIPQRPWVAFLGGFLGIFLNWSVIAALRNVQNDGILASKVAVLFPLGGSTLALVVVSALIGSLVGGFAAMSGCFLRMKPVQTNGEA